MIIDVPLERMIPHAAGVMTPCHYGGRPSRARANIKNSYIYEQVENALGARSNAIGKEGSRFERRRREPAARRYRGGARVRSSRRRFQLRPLQAGTSVVDAGDDVGEEVPYQGGRASCLRLM